MTNILIVDDMSSNLEILDALLSDEGHAVIRALTGAAALKQVHQHYDSLDLIMLDIMMPGMSGLELLTILKQNPQYARIPVIMVTANDDDKVVAQGLDLGAIDYIIKPFSSTVLLARVRAALREKERLDLLEKWATTDPLTGLLNRRYFFEMADRELERSNRQNSPVSFIMLDVDFFKQANDAYGHILADTILVELAKRFHQALRKVDFCCRFGGEEFVICLPDTPKKSAYEVAERIRLACSKPIIDIKDPITISLGVTTNLADDTIEQMLKRCDQALYEAKDAGRNQTKVN